MRIKTIEPLENIVKKLFKTQLTIFIVVIVSVILFTSYWGGKKQVEELVYADNLLSERVSDYINTAISDLKILTYSTPDSHFLEVIGKTNNSFDVLYYIAMDGALLDIYPKDSVFPIGRDMSSTPYFRNFQNETNISRPFISPKTGNPTIYISMPASDASGILVGELSLLGLQETLIRSKIIPSGIYFITDADGYLLANPQYSLVQEHVDIRKTGILEKAINGTNVQVNKSDGRFVLDIVIQNENTGYWTIVEESIISIFGPLIIPSLIGLVVTIGLLVLIMINERKDFSNQVVSPLVALKNDAQRLSEGNYVLISESSQQIDTFEEVSSLQSCYYKMKQAIESREIALAQEMNLLRTLIDNLPDSIYTKDINGRKTLANPADVLFCGKTNESEVLGKTDAELFPKEIAEKFQFNDQVVINTGKSVIGFEEQLVGISNAPIWLTTSKIPLRDSEGNITGLVGIGHDITERKKAEMEIMKLNSELELRVKNRTAALEEANQELESFSYSVSHDLRGPLRAIDGYSSVLLSNCSTILDEQSIQYFQQIRLASQKMGNLIEDLLKLSRISRVLISTSMFDLVVMAKEVIDQLKVLEPTRVFEFVHPAKMEIEADHDLMLIAVDNLIRNAWKFTSKLECSRIELGSLIVGDKKVIFIKDNGAGFEMKYADKLFGAFQRLHDNSEYEGTGIGLAIVKRIISHHGGKIWAEGKVNQGATFYFTLE